MLKSLTLLVAITLSSLSFASGLENIKLSKLENTLWRVGSMTTGYFWEYRFGKLNEKGILYAEAYHALHGETRGIFLKVDLKESSLGYSYIAMMDMYDGEYDESFYLDKKTGYLCNDPISKNVCMKRIDRITEFKF